MHVSHKVMCVCKCCISAKVIHYEPTLVKMEIFLPEESKRQQTQFIETNKTKSK